MPVYSKAQINERERVLESQKLLWDFFDKDNINNFVHLFDMKNSNISDNKFIKYIKDERKKRGLDDSELRFETFIYGFDKSNPSVIFTVIKNNNAFLHLSIHFAARSFDVKQAGVIHFYRDIFDITQNIVTKSRYLLIYVEKPKDKPNSLVFSTADDFLTSTKNKVTPYDTELEQEMDVIITVLNRLFDENNKEFYIGNNDKLVHIHNNTNRVLKNLNKFSQYVTRKNKGSMMYPPLINNRIYTLSASPKKVHRIKTSLTRKKHSRLPIGAK